MNVVENEYKLWMYFGVPLLKRIFPSNIIWEKFNLIFVDVEFITFQILCIKVHVLTANWFESKRKTAYERDMKGERE